MDGLVIGACSECKGGGSAEESAGGPRWAGDGVETLALTVPPHSVAGENLAVNCHDQEIFLLGGREDLGFGVAEQRRMRPPDWTEPR